MGRSFNPGNYQDEGDGGGGDYLRTAGEYAVVIKKFARGKSKSKKEYLQCVFKVIWGSVRGQVGKTFANRIFINDEALWKLGRMCKAMQYEEQFDLDSDREVRSAICNRPFLVRVAISQNNGKKFADIDTVLLRTNQEQEAAMEEWIAEFEAGKFDGQDDGGYSDHGSASGGPDDDIPF